MARIMSPELGVGTNGPVVILQDVKGVCFGAVLTVDRYIHPIVVGK